MQTRCFVCFWFIPRNIQGSLLALGSEITPDGAQGAKWNVRGQTSLNYNQDKHLRLCTISPNRKLEFTIFQFLDH